MFYNIIIYIININDKIKGDYIKLFINKKTLYQVIDRLLKPFIYLLIESGLFSFLIKKITNKPVIIINSQGGQLGNKLFLFARIISFANEHGYILINTDFYPYAHLFENTKNDFFCRYPVHRMNFLGIKFFKIIFSKLMTLIARYLENNNHKTMKTIRGMPQKGIKLLDSPSLTDIVKGKKIIFFIGWYFFYQSWSIKNKQEIKKYFIPLSLYNNRVNEQIQKIRNDKNILIGVHIRQYDKKRDDLYHSDYVYDDGIKTIKVMNKALKLFKKKQVVFILCSNFPLNKNFFINCKTYYGSGGIIEDILVLSKCDYLISTRSTYSSWASFYGDVPCYSFSDPYKEFSLDDFIVHNLQI